MVGGIKLSLIDIKVKQLLKSKVYDEIYISSNSSVAKTIADYYCIKFIDRIKTFCL